MWWIRRVVSRQDLDKGRLSGAVLTQQGAHLAARVLRSTSQGTLAWPEVFDAFATSSAGTVSSVPDTDSCGRGCVKDYPTFQRLLN